MMEEDSLAINSLVFGGSVEAGLFGLRLGGYLGAALVLSSFSVSTLTFYVGPFQPMRRRYRRLRENYHSTGEPRWFRHIDSLSQNKYARILKSYLKNSDK